MTARRPESEHLTPDPLHELLGSDEILKPRAAFRSRLRSELVTAPPTPTGWGLKLPGGQQLAPATSAMATVLLVSFTALAAYFFTDTVLPRVYPEVDVDAPVLVEPDLQAPPEGAPASDQPADGASRNDAAREAPGGPGLDADDRTGLDDEGTADEPDLDATDGSGGDILAPASPPEGAPGNNPAIAPPVVPAATQEAPPPPVEEPGRDEPDEPKEPRKQPTDPPIAPTDEPEASGPQPTPTNYVAPGRETRPPLPSPTPEPTETPTEEPLPILPIAPVNVG